ncbi:MAG: NUDIX domain-containing protein [Burkholderiaceae bacterium]|nr:NUDIX domain-containing protein [Burkholderiaceae bacterium]
MQPNQKNRELYPLVLVDVALFCIEEQRLKVLLVRRAQAPALGYWALPGGILKPETDSSLEAAALRVLRHKVSAEIPHLQEVRTFSGPDRDPRGWSVSVLFCALLPRDNTNALVNDKVEALTWADAAKPGQPLAFDHEEQLEAALQLLRNKVERHELPLHLLPELFTLTQLQQTCEAILGRALDKSVFRRRLKGSTDFVETDQFERGLQRPARLYRARVGFAF